MATSQGNDQGQDPKWWLAQDGNVEGPFDRNELIPMVESNKISRDAQVCLVGEKVWTPINRWPELEAHRQEVHPNAFSSPNSPYEPTPLLTNPDLPTTANWICIYCLLVTPFLWFLQNGTCCITFQPTFHEDSAYFGIELLFYLLMAMAGLLVTGLLFVGGLKLRSLKSSGARLIKIGICINLVTGSLGVLSFFAFVVVISVSGDPLFADETGSIASEIISYMSLALGLADLSFEIYALAWLYQNSRFLPYTAE